MDFKSSQKAARYLFFFGSASYALRGRADVSLHLAREEPVGSYTYERLENLSAPNVPNLIELGYDATREEFMTRRKTGKISGAKPEKICRDFFEDVVGRHFSE
jgi:hypothetical protein